MNFVGMYFVGGAFNLVFLVLSIIGYYYIVRKNGSRLALWWYFGAAWLLSLVSYIFLIFGTPSDALIITIIRVLTYLFFLAAIISMFVEIAKLKK